MTDTCDCKARNGGTCDLPAGWGTDNDEGPCKLHGGATPTKDENPKQGAPEGNTNAMTHGMMASPNRLYSVIPEEEKLWVDQLAAKYGERGDIEPTDPRFERIRRACIHMLQSLRGEKHIFEDGLSEETTIGIDESGNPIVTTDGHHLHRHVIERDKEARMILKDLSLLDSPEERQADAMQGLADAFSELDDDVIDV